MYDGHQRPNFLSQLEPPEMTWIMLSILAIWTTWGQFRIKDDIFIRAFFIFYFHQYVKQFYFTFPYSDGKSEIA